MVEFREINGSVEAIDPDAGFNPSKMTLQFVGENVATFFNTSTGNTEQVQMSDIPEQYLREQLEFERERLANSGSDEIREKIKTIEKELRRRD